MMHCHDKEDHAQSPQSSLKNQRRSDEKFALNSAEPP
tara:strand:- start:1245 stop:1355 length:111 start_codon:yes stop_codon:yes gene_type:complete